MAEIKLNKRYKYAGDIFRKLIDIGFDIETATAFLNEVADADVVPVVRCKDCKHYKKINYDDVNSSTCEITTKRQQHYDFCSYGERKKRNEQKG